MGVGDVELGRLDHRLVGRDRCFVLGDQRDLVGHLLLGDQILFGELLIRARSPCAWPKSAWSLDNCPCAWASAAS